MITRPIAVIGHVDHGKTALVRALTGIETDTSAEEKARGLSILVGFAHKTYAQGVIDFIDAPGHEDFIQAMVSGTSGAQAALLVVSATEGIEAQTAEHLRIARLLGIASGVIAVTKSDLLCVDAYAACLARLRAAVGGTVLEDAPMVMCSAKDGTGLEALHAALQDLLNAPSCATTAAQTMLPVDRVFTVAGHGTVVTGTLLGGDMNAGDAVVVQPSGHPTTLRGLQCRGAQRTHARAGERVAANLRNITADAVKRGDVVCLAPSVEATKCIDVEITALAAPLKHMQDLRVLFGTTSAVATLRLFGGGQLAQGQKGFAQLRFRHAVLGYEGQRAVLRRLSPSETLGGAAFMDCQAPQTSARDKAHLAVLAAIAQGAPQAIAQSIGMAQGGVVPLAKVARLARISAHQVKAQLGAALICVGTDIYAAPEGIASRKTEMVAALCAHHAAYPLHPCAPASVIALRNTAPLLQSYLEAALSDDGIITRRAGGIAFADHDPFALMSDQQHARLVQIDSAYQQAGLSANVAMSQANVAMSQSDDDALTDLLISLGRLVRLENVALRQSLLLHADALAQAARTLCATTSQQTLFTTSHARSALNTSRRIIVPVLEYFDAIQVTQRRGDARQMTGRLPVPPDPLPC